MLDHTRQRVSLTGMKPTELFGSIQDSGNRRTHRDANIEITEWAWFMAGDQLLRGEHAELPGAYKLSRREQHPVLN